MWVDGVYTHSQTKEIAPPWGFHVRKNEGNKTWATLSKCNISVQIWAHVPGNWAPSGNLTSCKWLKVILAEPDIIQGLCNLLLGPNRIWPLCKVNSRGLTKKHSFVTLKTNKFTMAYIFGSQSPSDVWSVSPCWQRDFNSGLQTIVGKEVEYYEESIEDLLFHERLSYITLQNKWSGLAGCIYIMSTSL